MLYFHCTYKVKDSCSCFRTFLSFSEASVSTQQFTAKRPGMCLKPFILWAEVLDYFFTNLWRVDAVWMQWIDRYTCTVIDNTAVCRNEDKLISQMCGHVWTFRRSSLHITVTVGYKYYTSISSTVFIDYFPCDILISIFKVSQSTACEVQVH